MKLSYFQWSLGMHDYTQGTTFDLLCQPLLLEFIIIVYVMSLDMIWREKIVLTNISILQGKKQDFFITEQWLQMIIRVWWQFFL